MKEIILHNNLSLIPIPAFTDNYIWMVKNNHNAIVIDPGDAKPVLDALGKDLKLSSILITHHHHDHTGGVSELKQATGAKVYGPRNENIPDCDVKLDESDIVNIGQPNLQFKVIDIPGHTSGHIAYIGNLDNDTPVIFCGDTLFAVGCGRVFEGTNQQMHASLCKIKDLAPNTLVCCAHEYTASNIRWALNVDPNNLALQKRADETTKLRAINQPTVPSILGLELKTNPFLRTDNADIIASANQYAAKNLSTPVDVFACLRQWKNDF